MKSFHKYLSISEVEEQWGLYITTAGYSKVLAGEIYPIGRDHPTTHRFTWNKGRILNDYYLVFISKGRGIFESDHMPQMEISEGHCFFLFPGSWHRYKPQVEYGWEEFWVGFNGYYPQSLMKADFFDGRKPCINVGLDEHILKEFKKLIETLQEGGPGHHQLISGYTLQLLSLVYRASIPKADTGEDDHTYISKAKFLLEEAIDADIKMTQIADKLAVSYSKFRKDFKQVTGMPPHQYHLFIRLNHAKELLETSHLTISEIAFQMGFESVFYFSKLFKKKYKLSPQHYRDKYVQMV
ncbi:AraC family transcriptional regulator [Olivibacter ginsenosidimutans]|uniref:AraC family transcriptional regulator n=1 Tax=Olivibacter ginsenosidimutans TaxID=1176537 RepID=A0ABP9C4V7_9SPHI